MHSVSDDLIRTRESIDRAFPIDYGSVILVIFTGTLRCKSNYVRTVEVSIEGEVRDDFGLNDVEVILMLNWQLSASGDYIIFDKAYSRRDLADIRFIDLISFFLAKK